MSFFRSSARILAAVAAALVAISATAAHATAPGGAEAANAIVLPFDVSAKKMKTRLFLESHRDDTRISVAFWDDEGRALADVTVCLDRGEVATLNPRTVASLLGPDLPIGPQLDLSGFRGAVIATAYAGCDQEFHESRLVDHALAGVFSVSEGGTKRSYDGSAMGFGLSSTGRSTDLPRSSYDRVANGLAVADLTLPSRVAKAGDFSRIFVVALRERAGRHGALGPDTVGIPYGEWTRGDGTTKSLDFRLGVFFGSLTARKDALLPYAARHSGGTIELGMISKRGSAYLAGFHAEHSGRLPTLRYGRPVGDVLR